MLLESRQTSLDPANRIWPAYLSFSVADAARLTQSAAQRSGSRFLHSSAPDKRTGAVACGSDLAAVRRATTNMLGTSGQSARTRNGSRAPTVVRPAKTCVPAPIVPVMCPRLSAATTHSTVLPELKIPLGVRAVVLPPVIVVLASSPSTGKAGIEIEVVGAARQQARNREAGGRSVPGRVIEHVVVEQGAGISRPGFPMHSRCPGRPDRS